MKYTIHVFILCLLFFVIQYYVLDQHIENAAMGSGAFLIILIITKKINEISESKNDCND
ncbi:hypothetical protein AAGS61_09105 [Lysinibacillus sp. KU-BSD001]|uniref:hypothetical protein n=1 Tax=Lysinibacillus sp. KU-BSD001 TaxID=3141328 RepID=UPI0036E95297